MQQSLPSITEVAKAGTFGLKLPALPVNPFVGLRPFNSDEALLYFGRREQTIELLQQLHRTHFVALVGSSGCGKSSLVRAGLIPKLKAGFLIEEHDQWLIATMKPGDAPLQNLADALSFKPSVVVSPSGGNLHSQSLPPEGGTTNLIAAVREGNAANVIECLTPVLTGSDANLLLLIDQFEELFRFGLESNKPENRAEATRFVELMLALSQQRQLPIYVVLTMRSDFIGDCDNFYGLPEAMNRSQYLVPRLTRKQLRQVIEGPVHLFGGSISPQLLDRILNDVGDKSDQLPVMQHTLMRTWERWQFEHNRNGDHEIDLPHYEAIGTIEEALSLDADAALNWIATEELKITERMFQTLSNTDENNRRNRRSALLSEICAITETSPEQVRNLVMRFSGNARSFLIASPSLNADDPRIEISHESLIRQWEQLGQWVQAEAESRDMYRRITDAACTYQNYGKKPDLLWSGTQLQLALEWKEEREPNQQWAQRYDQKFGLSFDQAINFLNKSLEATQRETEEIERKQKKSQRIASGVKAIITFLLLAIAFLIARILLN